MTERRQPPSCFGDTVEICRWAKAWLAENAGPGVAVKIMTPEGVLVVVRPKVER